jgi:hypothetical protein
MVMVLMPTALPCCVGSALRDKGLLHHRYRAAQASHHISEHRIRLDPHGLGREHCSHVAIGKVINNPHQLKRATGLNTKELFNCSLHHDTLALIAAQDITMLHVFSTRQDHGHRTTIGQHRC